VGALKGALLGLGAAESIFLENQKYQFWYFDHGAGHFDHGAAWSKYPAGHFDHGAAW
jgi:hypothetical protein